ncbi:MAG: TonB family protein [Bacteroidales bacterium]|jgi:protein TonB|nr:TonB family protein [Bacteroidales bacterium]
METKKSHRANLEKKRSLFFQAGLFIALAVALAAFEMPTTMQVSDIGWESSTFITDVTQVPITFPSPPLPPPPANPRGYDLEIVSDEVWIDDEFVFPDIETPTGNPWGRDFTQPSIKEEPDSVFLIVEEPPVMQGFREYLIKNMVYPETAAQNGIAGTVFVQFVINEDGEVVNAQIFRGVDPSLDAEALRLIGQSPKWKPGRQQGKAVKVKFTLPIIFKLQ